MNEEAIKESQERYFQVEKLVDEVLAMYCEKGCACQYPRFRQMVGIDCVDYQQAFLCWETELFISRVSDRFSKEKLEPTESDYRELWTCNNCKAEFLLAWSEFSIMVDRRVLKPKSIPIPFTGKDALYPIPLHAGLYGHGYPERSEIYSVDYKTFRKYLLEDE